MKKIIARPQEGKDVSLEVDDGLNNSQAAQKAAEILGIVGSGFVWDPQPFVFPKQPVREGQTFIIYKRYSRA